MALIRTHGANGGSAIVDAAHALKFTANTNSAEKVSFTSGTGIPFAATSYGSLIINCAGLSTITSIVGSDSNATTNTQIFGIGQNSMSALGEANTAGISNVNVSDYDYIMILYRNPGSGTSSPTFTITI